MDDFTLTLHRIKSHHLKIPSQVTGLFKYDPQGNAYEQSPVLIRLEFVRRLTKLIKKDVLGYPKAALGDVTR